MSIFPLPVFEADADPTHRSARTDEEIYAALEPPSTIVVRFGRMKLVGEYPYSGDAKPGCGSKLVARTHRGTELVEMLTSTCPNSGCTKSVSRKEMLDYIGNSGGKNYPFHTKGKILRVATVEDLNAQSALDELRQRAVAECKSQIRNHGLDMTLVEAEPILGGELLTFYYMSEDRVDFRDLVKDLASEFATRIEMVQVGARDEARLVADYERCGQHCCCKNFLKVLKPVSMGAAKRQKASLEPLKISGRCGRLMCCLRYEDQTYKDLKAQLPHRKTRVGTPDGPGIVLDTRVLVQLVLVKLEASGLEVAYPLEELMDPDAAPKPKPEPDPFRGMDEDEVEKKSRSRRGRKGRRKQDDYRKKSKSRDDSASAGDAEAAGDQSLSSTGTEGDGGDGESKPRKRRSRRRRRSGKGGKTGGQPGSTPQSDGGESGSNQPSGDASSGSGGGGGGDGSGKKKSRRRRRGRRGGRGRSGRNDSGGGSGGGDGGSGGNSDS